jgi:hypothetical protein
MSRQQFYDDEHLSAAVQAESGTQNAVHSPTAQPLARVAVAPKISAAPKRIDDPL